MPSTTSSLKWLLWLSGGITWSAESSLQLQGFEIRTLTSRSLGTTLATLIRFLSFISGSVIIFGNFPNNVALFYHTISHTIGPTGLHPSPAPHLEILQIFLIYFPKCPSMNDTQSYAPNVACYLFLSLNFRSICWWQVISSCWMLLLPWKSWL
jgi:hypothetical protein